MKPRLTDVDVTVKGLDLRVTGYYTPEDPGRYSGPPEKCYPAESSEFEITGITFLGMDAIFLIDSTFADEITEAAIAAIENE